MSERFSLVLEKEIAPMWNRALESRLARALFSDEPVGKELLQLYLIESYHYVKHNAQHQAMVVWRTDVRDRHQMRRALQHAIEEVDHDQLALRDLERMGVSRTAVEDSEPLAATRAFSGFLYDWVTRENPVGRLGYSLWAEGTSHIAPMLTERIRSKFAITNDKDISFIVAHAVLDKRHGEEAKESIDEFAKTEEDRAAVRRVAITSFELFIQLLDAIYVRYLEVKAGAPLLRVRP